MKQEKCKKYKRKSIFIFIAVSFLVSSLLLMPVMTGIVYNVVFDHRYEPASWLEFSVSDFEGLNVEETVFFSNEGQKLAGYCYSRGDQEEIGVVVLVHGLGCGGQNSYMPLADYFTSKGYFVFSYDATGNGRSQGDSVKGLPQGIIDLDYALRYVKNLELYKGLPIVLFGHSWGAYSAGAVLNLHPDVAAVVMASGPNRSIDLMVQESKRVVGWLAYPAVPYLIAYERYLFGEYASYSSMAGFDSSDAGLMILHSADDENVTTEIGYDQFFDRYKTSPRFQFVLYENRGHDAVFYSHDAAVYRQKFEEEYRVYVESQGGKQSDQIKKEFADQSLDKSKMFELDQKLMSGILEMFNSYCSK